MSRNKDDAYKKYLLEVEGALRKLERAIPEGIPEAYVGGKQSKLEYLGLKVPQQRGAYKKGFSFNTLEDETVTEIWDFIWNNSSCYEVMALALMWFAEKNRLPHLKRFWPILMPWSSRIDNWAHSDVLSSLYARILEEDEKLVYPTLQVWSDSKNPWLRRLSIVSLIYYAGARKKVVSFAKIMKLLEKQIEQDHHYIQRGVGWTLREMGAFYPKETSAFLKENCSRLSAIAFAAATEKISKKEKEALKKLRKK